VRRNNVIAPSTWSRTTSGTNSTARGAILLAFDVKADEHPRIVGNLDEAG
jgi:hypothetical protein